MNRFFAFFVVSLVIHAIVGAVLLSRSGILGGKGEEEAVEVSPVEESEEPRVEPVEKPVVKPKKIKKPSKPKKTVTPKPVVEEIKKEEPVETPPPKTESLDKKPETQEEEPQDESELIEPTKEETPSPEVTEPSKEEDESELIEPEKEEVKPEEKKEESPAPAPLGSDIKKPSVLEIKQARSHSQLKQIAGNPLPVYPKEALKKKWEGRVEVIYYVNPGGFVEQIQLKQSSGHSALDNSALRALSRYRYRPGQEGWVQHPVEFFLEKGKEIKEVAPLGVPE